MWPPQLAASFTSKFGLVRPFAAGASNFFYGGLTRKTEVCCDATLIDAVAA